MNVNVKPEMIEAGLERLSAYSEHLNHDQAMADFKARVSQATSWTN